MKNDKLLNTYIQDIRPRFEDMLGQAVEIPSISMDPSYAPDIRRMAELAAQSLYTQGPETQDFESVTISLPTEKVTELKAKIHELIKAVAAEHSRPGDAVYQLNIQLFALTKSAEKKETVGATAA